MLELCSRDTASVWFEAKERAVCLRQYRGQMHPGLEAELADLERAGY